MKNVVLIITMFLSFNALAAEKCLRVVDYGSICLEPINGKSWFENDIAISIYEGEKLVHEMEGKSGALQKSFYTCGGKEHDCWTIPTRFNVFAEDAHYRVILNLSPFGPTVNKCVRCSGSGLVVDGKSFKVQ